MTGFNKIAVYPGTFDPITNGHLDIIKRARKIFDHVVVAVTADSDKNPIFSSQQRRDMILQTIVDEKLTNVSSEVFTGLLVDFVKSKKSSVIVRGLRAVSDFEYEFQMSCINSKLNSEIDTIFLPSKDDMHFVSSRFIKAVAKLGGDVSQFVPNSVYSAIKSLPHI